MQSDLEFITTMKLLQRFLVYEVSQAVPALSSGKWSRLETRRTKEDEGKNKDCSMSAHQQAEADEELCWTEGTDLGSVRWF